MSWPENDPYLHELRRKWDDGHFRQDADSVYGVDEAIDEAIDKLLTDSNYDFPSILPDGGGIGTINPPTAWLSPAERVDHLFAQELAKGMFDSIDRQLGGDKTCRICRLTSVNDPCDTCYGRWRKASQTPSEAGICVFCQNKSPSVICVTCVNRVLKDGL